MVFVISGIIAAFGVSRAAFIPPSSSPPTASPTGVVGIPQGGTGTSTTFSAGSVVFAGATGAYSQDNLSLYWDDTNNKLGIGTTSPAYALSINGSDVLTAGVALTRASADNFGGTVRTFKARGTLSLPAAVVADDTALRLEGFGYDGAAYDSLGYIDLRANAISAGVVSGKFVVAVADSAGTLRNRIITLPDGKTGIGDNLTPAAKFHVNSASGEDAFRAQVNGSTKFWVNSNGGTAIGSLTTPPTNGLYVGGNVGIVVSPNTALDVNGALSMRGMAAPAASLAGQGRIYFDSTANKFKVSENAGAYADLAGGGGVPAGAVSFFNLAACPSGWTELTAARGRFLIGLDLAGTLAGTGGATPFTNLANPFNTNISHTHTVTTTCGGPESSPDRSSILGNECNSAGETTRTFSTESSGSGTTHTPPYIQLLVCQKS